MEASTATLKNNLAAPLETKVDFPYNLAITLLGIYPSESKTDFHTAVCTQVFTAALFVIGTDMITEMESRSVVVQG